MVCCFAETAQLSQAKTPVAGRQNLGGPCRLRALVVDSRGPARDKTPLWLAVLAGRRKGVGLNAEPPRLTAVRWWSLLRSVRLPCKKGRRPGDWSQKRGPAAGSVKVLCVLGSQTVQQRRKRCKTAGMQKMNRCKGVRGCAEARRPVAAT